MRVGWDPEGLELGQVGWKEEPGREATGLGGGELGGTCKHAGVDLM